MAIEITRKELTAAELRAAAGKVKDSRAARRMLAIAFVLEGADRTSAATSCGMDRQTLRDWVHRYNAEGLAGLANRRSPGASPLLTPEQKAELAALVEAGPDPQRDGVVRWRRIDLQARIKALFGVAMHERPSVNFLAASNWRRSAFGGCRCARATRRPTRVPRKRSKKLPGGGSGGASRSGEGQAARDLVSR